MTATAAAAAAATIVDQQARYQYLINILPWQNPSAYSTPSNSPSTE
jgi:hypothetical protein